MKMDAPGQTGWADRQAEQLVYNPETSRADEMLKVRPGLRVLFTSGYTENAIIHHGRLDEGVLLLAKPYRKSDMAIMVRKALTEGSPPPRLQAVRS